MGAEGCAGLGGVALVVLGRVAGGVAVCALQIAIPFQTAHTVNKFLFKDSCFLQLNIIDFHN